MVVRRRGALIVLALAVSALPAACSPLALVNVLVPRQGYAREADIAYGAHPRQRLDVYRPTDAAPGRPVVVFLYGGSWKSGARGNYRFVGEAFAARGYPTVIPDYRLYPEVRFPTFVDDAAAAVAWVRREIGARGGDPDRIVMVGHSAGAYIAALLALDPRYLSAAGVPPGAIKGVAGLAGPYAFDPLQYRSTRAIFEAADPASTRPIAFAGAAAPPMLLLHGGADTTVFPYNSEALARALGDAGAAVRHVPLDGIGHIGILLALAAPFQGRTNIIEQIVDFIDATAD